jgi:hypothetical protein
MSDVLLLEFLGHKEARPGQHPVVGITHQQNVPGKADVGQRLVAEQQVPAGQHWRVRIEGIQVQMHIGDLDEIAVVMLFDRDEHPQDVAQQMGPALGHAVDQDRLLQRRLVERGDLCVQRVLQALNDSHAAPPARRC